MDGMKKYPAILSAFLVSVSVALHAAVCDDFFKADSWRLMKNIPGELAVAPGEMLLRDAPGKPEWAVAVRTFDVDLERDPVFNLKIGSVDRGGEVKLIRGKEKKSVLKFKTSGIYSYDLRKIPGWTGKSRITVCLYVWRGGEAVFESLCFAPEAEKEKGLKLVPSFNACSYYWYGPEQKKLNVRFREQNGEWKNALAPVRGRAEGGYRGSLLELKENTGYEFLMTGDGGKELARGKFRTWSSEVPVAKTIVLDAKNFSGELKISERGRPDGWIRYTASPGFVLASSKSEALLRVENAAYILLDGLTLRGGGQNAVEIRKSRFVRIVNCDISGWGRLGVQRFDKDGKFYLKNGKAVNYDAGILISRSHGTVVERCYIHDPRTTANSWRYSHPAGPCGLMIDKPTSTVLRYNDIVGSDNHRWNDAVEGSGNFHPDGGFNRDADIYGNWMIFCNDDNIELDGGQQNVRCSYNRFEGAFCGISIQGCMTGPSYLFRNLLMRPGCGFDRIGQTIKTSSKVSGPDAVSYIFHNTMDGEGSGISLLAHLKIVAENNIFSGLNRISNHARSPQSECDGNLQPVGSLGREKNGFFGSPAFSDPEKGIYTLKSDSSAKGKARAIDTVSVKGEDLGAFSAGRRYSLPYRPIPVELDCGVVDFEKWNRTLSAKCQIVVTVGGEGFKSEFSIRKNNDSDWFEVTPASGTLRSGERLTLTVRLLPEKMNRYRHRGAFLLRLKNGFSRPVSVYADNVGRRIPPRPEAKSLTAFYRNASQPDSGHRYPLIQDAGADNGTAIRLEGERGKNPAEYKIHVPKAGKYYLLLRVRSERPVGQHDSVFCSVDDEPLQETHLSCRDFWSWSPAHPGGGQFKRLKQYDLSAGTHIVRIAPREPLDLDLIAFATNPAPFEAD